MVADSSVAVRTPRGLDQNVPCRPQTGDRQSADTIGRWADEGRRTANNTNGISIVSPTRTRRKGTFATARTRSARVRIRQRQPPFARRQNHEEHERDRGDQLLTGRTVGGSATRRRRSRGAGARCRSVSPFPDQIEQSEAEPCRHRDADDPGRRTTESFIRRPVRSIPPAGTSR